MQLRPIHIVVLIIGLGVIVGGGWAAYRNLNKKASRTEPISVQAPVGTASLTMVPSATTTKVGDQFTVTVSIDSGSTDEVADRSSGTDLVIDFDPNLVEVIDADPTVAGVQIGSGAVIAVYDFVQANSVNNTKGIINFSAGQQPTSSGIAISKQTIASITFKAKAAGTAQINFKHQPGALSDTNIIKSEDGRDLLNKVTNAAVTINQ